MLTFLSIVIIGTNAAAATSVMSMSVGLSSGGGGNK
jgi:hypothetical protein